MKLSKSDQPGYAIDETKHVVINTNEKDLKTYRALVAQTMEVQDLRSEIETMKEVIAKLIKG
jgi:hypothetical protein